MTLPSDDPTGLAAPTGWHAIMVRARPGATLAAAAATLTACAVLLPLFAHGAWILPTMAAIAVVALTGAAWRALCLPIPLQPIAQVLVLLCLVTTMFARSRAFAGFLPGSEALDRLRSLAHAGLLEADTVLAPAGITTPLVLLTVGGIGVVAMIVDVLGVSLRLPAAAGLPLLAVYALPVAVVRDGVPWWLLAVGVSGWLILLYVDSRHDVSSWGALLSVPRSASPSRRAEPSAGGRALALGAVTLAVGLVATAVIPGLTEPVFVSGPRDGAGLTGPADSVSLDPFVSLRRQLLTTSDQELLTYTTDAERPSYLRLATLENFDGVSWTQRPADIRIAASERLPAPPTPGIADKERSTYRVSVSALDNPQLPLPYAATDLSGLGATESVWSWDPVTRTVSAPGTSSRGMDYSVEAVTPLPTVEELSAATAPPGPEMKALLALPSNVSPLLLRTAQEVTRNADTPYEKAMALVQWFTEDGDFLYSTSVTTPDGEDPMESFLTERIGYCQQFAGTMAAMARAVGIPSRVSVGFTAGRRAQGIWEVRARNAHAWPELWFAGVGWVWFEPTPRHEAGAGVAPPTYASPVERDGAARERDRTTQEPAAPKDRAPDAASSPSAGMSSGGSWAWLLLPVVASLLILPWLATVVRRRWRTRSAQPAARIAGAWLEVGDSARDLEWTWRLSATPRQAGAELNRSAALTGEQRQALTRLVWWTEQARYARSLGAAPTGQQLRADLTLVRRGLRRRCSTSRRLRAVLLPPSLFGSGRSVEARADDARTQADDEQAVGLREGW